MDGHVLLCSLFFCFVLLEPVLLLDLYFYGGFESAFLGSFFSFVLSCLIVCSPL